MMRPKKKFGQHFLIDEHIADNIITNAHLHTADTVWEIGPGHGALTNKLLQQNINLRLYEIDHDLIPALKSKYADKCNIYNVDILKIDWQTEITGKPFKIVTNLPYQISSPFLYKLVEHYNYLQCVVVMLQKEVAKRLSAKPCCKDYGVLSLKTQFYFDIEYLFDVPPSSFNPPPSVVSAVVRLIPRVSVPMVDDTHAFWQLVERCFVSRRKTLRNNLRGYDLDRVNIDLGRRAEELSEGEFLQLYWGIATIPIIPLS